MTGFAKLYSSIVTSSIWVESDHIVRVWIALLACANADGYVEGSVPGFANLARVSVDQMEDALKCFCSPDPHSRTKDYEGRRIEVKDGGWVILNYPAYRLKKQGIEGSRAPYYRDYRRKKREAALKAAAEGNGHDTAREFPCTWDGCGEPSTTIYQGADRCDKHAKDPDPFED